MKTEYFKKLNQTSANMLTVLVNNGDLDTEANGGRLNDFADIMLPIARAVTGKDITKKDILDNLAAISSGNAFAVHWRRLRNPDCSAGKQV